MRRKIGVLAAVLPMLVGMAVVPHSAAAPPPAPKTQLRVDQAGYLRSEPKFAVLMSPTALHHPRVVVLNKAGHRVFTATVHRRRSWSNDYRYVYGLHFDAMRHPGRYRLALAGTNVRSPRFRVTSVAGVWTRILRYGVRFDQVQRDGAAVVRSRLHRRPSHLLDRHAFVYAWPHFERGSDVIKDRSLHRIGGPVNVAGGWFDAGDYLKFTHSTAYADVLLYTAARELGRAAPRSLRREARHGLNWLAKLWDPKHKVLYLQVGIGSGNSAGTFYGDHDLWRLPQRDDRDHARIDRFATHRPVFEAAPPRQRISPNLVGRTSAAFALAAQSDARTHPHRARHELREATSLYAMADTSSPPHPLVSALPHAFYPESSWRDDMELGAVEIARGLRLLHRSALGYLRDAGRWARGYERSGNTDTFNLYDVSALADTELARTMGGRHVGVTRHALLGDLRSQLHGAAMLSARDPFAAGVDDTQFDVDSHTLGLVATAAWYASLTHSRRYVALAAKLRGWVYGANAWGTSFMVGIGSTFPHCMQHQVANLAGSTNGKRPLDVGAVVNGPNGAGLFEGGVGGFQDGMVHCPGPGSPAAVPRRRFDGSGSVFLDDVRSWQTDEPALDMTGAAIIAAAGELSVHR